MPQSDHRTVLRRYGTRSQSENPQPNICHRRIGTQTQTDTGEKTLSVTGLELTDRQNGNAKSIHSADIVVNASGRADKFYTWLKAKGAQITEQRDDAEIITTQDTTRCDGVEEPERDSDNPSAVI